MGGQITLEETGHKQTLDRSQRREVLLVSVTYGLIFAGDVVMGREEKARSRLLVFYKFHRAGCLATALPTNQKEMANRGEGNVQCGAI